MSRIPDTGQNTSYTNTFGEDSDYNFNSLSYTVNSNGTVTDEVTGLIWARADAGEMTYESAILYCDTLTLGGFTDWRLPNAHEAFSILDQQNNNPAIDINAFTTSAAEYWWTADRQVNDSTKIWVTNAGGGIGNHPKSETISAGGNKRFHVRSVRSNSAPEMVQNQFVVEANASILDQLSGFYWTPLAFGDSLTWENALIYADTCTRHGKDDWRLPNIKELQSINLESWINPSIDPNFFTNAPITKYWSSTTLPNQTGRAWFLDTHFGITTYKDKTARLDVLLVRGTGENSLGFSHAHNTLSTPFFPNPFQAFIQIDQKLIGERCILYSSIGNLIYDGFHINQIDFSTLPAGLYLVDCPAIQLTKTRLIKLN